MNINENAYHKVLSSLYPTKDKAGAALAFNEQTLRLPKAPELYASDIHGEYEAFSYIVRSGCHALEVYIDAALGDEASDEEKQSLATLICYPKEKRAFELVDDVDEYTWYEVALSQVLSVLQAVKLDAGWKRYTNELDSDWLVLAESLISLPTFALTKASYGTNDALRTVSQDGAAEGSAAFLTTIDALVEADCAAEFLDQLCFAIQHLLVGKLHIIGDIYDRGPSPESIMDELIAYPNVDVQWGNHDIVWMGAAKGQRGCIAHVVRNCARYGNLSIITDAYGINILPLATFALKTYKDDPCTAFQLKTNPGLSPEELDLNIKIQKAMAILQFKVEGQLIDENPSFGLEDRKLLHRINYDTKTIVIDGTEYDLTDTYFPTVDKHNPYALTEEEEYVMQSLQQAFMHCEKLQRHMQFFLEKGSLYAIENNMLMFHACVPLTPDGTLKEVNLFGETYKGKALFDAVDTYVRAAFSATDPAEQKQGLDLIWYLWLGEGSPLFAKSKMATFEIYLVEDKAARKEVKNSFYTLFDKPEVYDAIFEDFGMDPHTSHIVCGHTPVKVKDGEDPIKCGGKVVIIDGGFSDAYQKTTGIAGFTLVSDTNGIHLASHEPFAGRKAAIEQDATVHSTWRELESTETLRLVANTDEGAVLAETNDQLLALIQSR